MKIHKFKNTRKINNDGGFRINFYKNTGTGIFFLVSLNRVIKKGTRFPITAGGP